MRGTSDRTAGCIALANHEVEDLRRITSVGPGTGFRGSGPQAGGR
jgi:hypothetical protein